MKKSILLTVFSLILISLFAQKNRYDFASSYFGFEGEFIKEKNSFKYINDQGNEELANLPSTFTPRIIIGATHFWNHADFYISIPIFNFTLEGDNSAHITNDVLTGLRAYPFAIEQNKIRPFVGIGLSGKEYRQEASNGKSQWYTNWQGYYEGGLTYSTKKNKLLSIELKYFPRSSYNVFYDNENALETKLSPLSLSFSYKKVMDFTRVYKSESSQKYLQDLKESYQKRKAFNTYSIGIGLSALIPLSKTELASSNDFINDEIEGNLGLDIGFGYYHHKLDAAARISYRPFTQEEISYDYSYKSQKHSLALEAFKFIGDYHGFVPFIGPYISADNYSIQEKSNKETIIDYQATKIGYGLIFGWDIRLSDVDYFILRTNLRYTPDFSYKIDGYSFTPAQIEFNFIQLVFYPERIKANKNLYK